MHIIQVVRNYLGLSQLELSKKAGLSQPDLCEMETKEPYGRIDKYQRLSNFLGIPIHALITNDCTQIPLSFLISTRILVMWKPFQATISSLAEAVKKLCWLLKKIV